MTLTSVEGRGAESPHGLLGCGELILPEQPGLRGGELAFVFPEYGRAVVDPHDPGIEGLSDATGIPLLGVDCRPRHNRPESNRPLVTVARRVIQAIREEDGADQLRLHVIGGSRGATAGLITAALMPSAELKMGKLIIDRSPTTTGRRFPGLTWNMAQEGLKERNGDESVSVVDVIRDVYRNVKGYHDSDPRFRMARTTLTRAIDEPLLRYLFTQWSAGINSMEHFSAHLAAASDDAVSPAGAYVGLFISICEEFRSAFSSHTQELPSGRQYSQLEATDLPFTLALFPGTTHSLGGQLGDDYSAFRADLLTR